MRYNMSEYIDMNKFIQKINCKWSWFKYKIHKKIHKLDESPITDLGYALEHWFIEQNGDKLDKIAAENCVFEERKIGDKTEKLMSWASDEYRKFFNENIVRASMKLIEDAHIEKYKYKKGKYLILYGDRLGILCGKNNSLLDFLKKDMNIEIKLKNGNSNSIYHQIGSLEYSYCVNNWEDLL